MLCNASVCVGLHMRMRYITYTDAFLGGLMIMIKVWVRLRVITVGKILMRIFRIGHGKIQVRRFVIDFFNYKMGINGLGITKFGFLTETILNRIKIAKTHRFSCGKSVRFCY